MGKRYAKTALALSLLLAPCLAEGDENALGELLNTYYGYLRTANKSERTEDKQQEYARAFEDALQRDASGPLRVYGARALANIYYDVNDYRRAEQTFAQVLEDSAFHSELPAGIALEAAYYAYQSALYNGTPPERSMAYMDVFDQVFDASSDDKEVFDTFGSRRIQTYRYRAIGYENQYIGQVKGQAARNEGPEAAAAAAAALKKAVEYQQKYVQYIGDMDSFYGVSDVLARMDWGREGSLYKLAELQEALASVPDLDRGDALQARQQAVVALETLLTEFPKQKFSQKGTALLIRQKAYSVASAADYLEYCRALIDKAAPGYEVIHALREVAMQIASHNRWPGGVEWNDSGEADAVRVAIALLDIAKSAVKRYFPDTYAQINVLKHILMLQTEYNMKVDDMGAAFAALQELNRYGVQGEYYEKLYANLNQKMYHYIGISDSMKENLEAMQLGDAVVRDANRAVTADATADSDVAAVEDVGSREPLGGYSTSGLAGVLVSSAIAAGACVLWYIGRRCRKGVV